MISTTGMACRDLDISWTEYVREPSQLWDNPDSKMVGFASQRDPMSPDSIHTQTRQLLWMDDWNNPPWVCREVNAGGELCAVAHRTKQDWIELMKACSRQKDLHQGTMIHADIIRTGLLKTLGAALVRMYAKCGMLATAQEVFDGLPVRNAVAWNAIIAGCAEHGFGDKALYCFKQMRDEGFVPDRVTFLCALKACGSIGATKKGEELHAEVRRLGLLDTHDIILGTALVDMYAKCGALAKAQEVFDGLSVRDQVCWNALISGYAQHGLGQDALNCLDQMRDEGFSPNTVTFICVLKACSSIRATKKGKEIHAEVRRLGLLENHDTVLGTALVDMYAKCGALTKAQEVLDGLPVRNAASWNALITGYAQRGLGKEALQCLRRMRNEGFSPNNVTFICILKACGSIGAIEKGEEIHAEVRRMGLLDNHDIVLGTALVDMYAKCGALAKAEEVLRGLPSRTVVSWNALIAGYVQHGLNEEALNCFERMQDEGFSPDTVTFVSSLTACGSIGATEKGKELHAEAHSLGLLEGRQHVLGNALVNMYAKCGALAEAQKVFDGLLIQDIVAWNSLIDGYAQYGLSEEALNCYKRLQDEGPSPDDVTFLSVLKACGNIGATEKGEEIHAEVRRLGLLEDHNVVLGTALVDTYAKCGALTKAQEVFDGLPVRDAVSWNALMAGYARLGKPNRVFNLFSKMRGDCLEPDGVTFSALLTACSHAGLVEEGQLYFDIMSTVYCIIPSREHYAGVVDLFSRAGHFDKAINMIQKVPDTNLWLALLGGCRKWVNVELGRWAFEQALQLDEKSSAAYVCMCNIYAAAGMQEEAEKVEALRTKNGAWKIPGSCWIDVGGDVHLYTLGD